MRLHRDKENRLYNRKSGQQIDFMKKAYAILLLKKLKEWEGKESYFVVGTLDITKLRL